MATAPVSWTRDDCKGVETPLRPALVSSMARPWGETCVRSPKTHGPGDPYASLASSPMNWGIAARAPPSLSRAISAPSSFAPPVLRRDDRHTIRTLVISTPATPVCAYGAGIPLCVFRVQEPEWQHIGAVLKETPDTGVLEPHSLFSGPVLINYLLLYEAATVVMIDPGECQMMLIGKIENLLFLTKVRAFCDTCMTPPYPMNEHGENIPTFPEVVSSAISAAAVSEGLRI